MWDRQPAKTKNSFVNKFPGLKIYVVVREETRAKLNKLLVGQPALAASGGFRCGDNSINFNCPLCEVGMYANMDIRQSSVNAEENHNEKRVSYEVSHGVIDSGQAESEGSPKSKSQRIGNE